jgi:uncharacterized membrane protein
MAFGLFPQFFYFMLPPFLLLIIFFGYLIKTGMFLELGLPDTLVGLLVLGPLAAMLFDFPVFLYHDYFLGLNIGGAIIPLTVALYFVSKKRMGILPVFFGIAIISIITFFVTEVKDIGVVSPFPYYLIPSIIATIIAFLFFDRNSATTPGYAYAIATLGVIIGADIFHLPEIADEPFQGSLGGAGLYDMVFLAGLLSLCLCLPFMGKPVTRAPYPPQQGANHLKETLRSAHHALKTHRYSITLQQSLTALQMKLLETRHLYTGIPSSKQTLRALLGATAQNDYDLLRRTMGKKDQVTRQDARKGLMTTLMLIECLSKKETERFPSVLKRIGAYFTDVLLVGSLAILFYFLIPSSFSTLFILFVFFFSIHFLYFTFFEYLYGATPGKYLLGMRLIGDHGNTVTFIGIFTRNIIRFWELMLGFYSISLLMILLSPWKQRLGDRLGHVLVVKNF